MTVYGMDRRIRKLEGILPEGLASLTWDELNVRRLECAYGLVSDETEAEVRDKLHETIAEIEADIIATATKQASPEYAKHLEWCRAMWGKRTRHADGYITALTGGGSGEYQDWEKPDVMARRSALRSSPIVQEILARLS